MAKLKCKKDSFWSPSGVKSLIVLVERVIALITKLYKIIDFFYGKGGLSSSLPV